MAATAAPAAPDPTPATLKTWSLDALQAHADALAIDRFGSRAALIERIRRHQALAARGPAASPAPTDAAATDASAPAAAKSAKPIPRRRKKVRGATAKTAAAAVNSATTAAPNQTTSRPAARRSLLSDTEAPNGAGAAVSADDFQAVFAHFALNDDEGAAAAEAYGARRAGTMRTDGRQDDRELLGSDDDDDVGGGGGGGGNGPSASSNDAPRSPKGEGAEDGAANGHDSDDGSEGEGAQAVSRAARQRALRAKRISVAELKQKASNPAVVEWVDTTARDPLFLAEIKALPNTVPVPSHWSQKRKYLQNKRGQEKAPFELPEFIRATGIMDLRETGTHPADMDGPSLAQQARSRMRPKMGGMDIDYQKLHDAFFRWQTKPELSIHGDLYYEGKENVTRIRQKDPGHLSDALRHALNIPPHAPPPWLINMQRFGPPPSYPLLKIPGLNAPIPEGAQWGYHPGGWGRPPLDESNRPLYGDVFSTATQRGSKAARSRANNNANADLSPGDGDGVREEWGHIPSDFSDDDDVDEHEENDGEPDGPDGDRGGAFRSDHEAAAPAEPITEFGNGEAGAASAVASPPGKRPPAPEGTAPPRLYTVIPEVRVDGDRATHMMGSDHRYDLTARSGETDRVILAPEDMAPPPAADGTTTGTRTHGSARGAAHKRARDAAASNESKKFKF